MLLKLVNPDPSSLTNKTSIEVEFSIRQSALIAQFKVAGQSRLNLNPDLPVGSSQWGLWDWDVVELFVRANGDPAYYEFQVSPLGQVFELEIFEPRRRVNKDFRSGFGASAERLGETSWHAEMSIPLARLDWDRRIESIQGNAFAILGGAVGGEPRTYWSAFLPPQLQPDFHLPSYFKSLF